MKHRSVEDRALWNWGAVNQLCEAFKLEPAAETARYLAEAIVYGIPEMLSASSIAILHTQNRREIVSLAKQVL